MGMSVRAADWFRQAEADLQHARHALRDGDHEWACFAAQQAAEKAVKATLQKPATRVRGNSVTMLLANLSESIGLTTDLIDKAKELDKHYIASRYPYSWPSGAPFQYYTESQAERSIQYADEIISFCGDILSGKDG